MKKSLVIDSFRRQSLLMCKLSQRLKRPPVVLNIVCPIVFSHELPLFVHCRSSPGDRENLRIVSLQTIEGHIPGLTKRFEQCHRRVWVAVDKLLLQCNDVTDGENTGLFEVDLLFCFVVTKEPAHSRISSRNGR